MLLRLNAWARGERPGRRWVLKCPAYGDMAEALFDAYPDVRPTVLALKGAGYRTAILSNGTPTMLTAVVSRSDLTLTAQVTGVEEERFRAIAEGAKANCPISKLLNADISLDFTLNG